MSLRTDKKLVTSENLKQLVKELNEKNTNQTLLIYNEINLSNQKIEDEEDRAIKAEIDLKNIFEEKLNAKTNLIDQKLDTEILKLTDELSKAATGLQDALDLEVTTRSSQDELQNERISGLDRALTDSINAKTQALNNDLSSKISSLRLDFTQTTHSLNDRIDSVVEDYENKYSNVSNEIQEHLDNFNNPHNITLNQIGAASQNDLIEADNQINNLKAVVKDLEDNKLNNIGEDQQLLGSLIIGKNADSNATGNLTVQGNLIVKGKTTTVDNETLAVRDNFILINSDGEEVGTSLSGIAIKTNSTTAYGIAYDPVNKSVSLGNGVITDKNDFVFLEGENNPILTRSESTELQDGHLLIWDAQQNKAVDGGAYDLDTLKKEFSTWEDNHKLAYEIHVLDNKDEAQGPLGRVTVLEKDLQEKQDIEDANLKTKSKNIVGAINEVFEETSSHHRLSDLNPLSNGEVADPGVSNEGSRADHVHPTDLSRAPINHASESNMYGQATNTKYGHVIVDDILNSESTNPVQNKVITKKLDGKLDKLTIQNSAGVYGVSYGDQKQIMFPLNSGNIAWTVMYRNGNGRSNVSDPTPGTTEIANAKYVDDKVSSIQVNIDSKLNASTNKNIVYSNDSSGKASTIVYSDKASQDTIAIRNSDSNFEVLVDINQTNTKYVANIGYVKTKLLEESNIRSSMDESLNTKIDTINSNLQNAIDTAFNSFDEGELQ